MSTHYFQTDCPDCEHELRLCYAYDEGHYYDPGIVDSGKCNCLLGQEWLEDALADYLNGRYVPVKEDFLP